MKTFREWLAVRNVNEVFLSRDSAESIVFNALNIGDSKEAQDAAYNQPLETYGQARLQILQNKDVQNLPNYEDIKSQVETQPDKITVGTLIDELSKNPIDNTEDLETQAAV